MANSNADTSHPPRLGVSMGNQNFLYERSDKKIARIVQTDANVENLAKDFKVFILFRIILEVKKKSSTQIFLIKFGTK